MASPCPTCKREALPRPGNREAPFCSPRCKALDLGKWLGGDYRIAAPNPDAEDDALPTAAAEPGEEEAEP